MKFLLVVLLVMFASCSNQAKRRLQMESTEQNLCSYSKYLRIFKTKNGYVIRIQHPDRKDQHFEYLISEPVKHMAVLSATHIGMLSALHEENRIAAISDIRYVYSPIVKKRIKQKHILELQTERSISVDNLLRSKSQYVIYSAFSGTFSQENRLEKLGVRCIPNFDWREQTALGKAEWVLLFGVLSGKVSASTSLFHSIERSYLKSKETNQPLIEMISGNVTGDYWYAPAGQSFMAEIFRKSGLSYRYAKTKGTGSLAYSMEKIMKDGTQVKIWLNPGFPSKKEIVQVNPKAKFLPFFKHARIYCYTHNSNKYWELSTLRPDWLVADLSQIAANKSTNNLHFYQEVK